MLMKINLHCKNTVDVSCQKVDTFCVGIGVSKLSCLVNFLSPHNVLSQMEFNLPHHLDYMQLKDVKDIDTYSQSFFAKESCSSCLQVPVVYEDQTSQEEKL